MPSLQSLLVLTAGLVTPIISLTVPLEARTLEARIPPVSYFLFQKSMPFNSAPPFPKSLVYTTKLILLTQGIPTTAAAKTQLAALTVAVQGTQDGYDRDLFPTWITISGTCNTRETVLKRDGTNVVVSTACAATSGSWYSPYDGATWTAASDVDIDHMVPLSNAWKSGAAAWTTAQRQAFANDLTNPQLWAVTDNVNQSKSDSGPEDWKPPLGKFFLFSSS